MEVSKEEDAHKEQENDDAVEELRCKGYIEGSLLF